jgi:hypothetical protein
MSSSQHRKYLTLHKKDKGWCVYGRIGTTDQYELIGVARKREEGKKIVELYTIADGIDIEALKEYIRTLRQIKPWPEEITDLPSTFHF